MIGIGLKSCGVALSQIETVETQFEQDSSNKTFRQNQFDDLRPITSAQEEIGEDKCATANDFSSNSPQ